MRALLVLAAALALPFGACVAGPTPTPPFGALDGPLPKIYSHTVIPLDINEKSTSNTGPDNSRGDIKRISYYNVSATWGDNSIGELGKRAGFDEVLYADLEVLSVFFGIWTQTWVHVYGR